MSLFWSEVSQMLGAGLRAAFPPKTVTYFHFVSVTPELAVKLVLVQRIRTKDMAAAGPPLSPDRFLCSICVEVLVEPVSTPCGHNFCHACVRRRLQLDAPFQCPACLQMFYPKPELQVNALLAEVVQMFRTGPRAGARRTEAVQVFRTGPRAGARGTALLLSVFTCTLVLSSLVQPVREEAGSGPELGTGHPDETLRSLKESVDQILTKLAEMEAVCELRAEEAEETERFSSAQLQHIFSSAIRKELPELLLRTELMKLQRDAVDVTFDPDTANPQLVLSDDGKQVRCCDSRRKVPEHPRRFVLGKQLFSSGRFYFEVQVRGKTEWGLGVAKESADRRGDVLLRPQLGYWAVRLRGGRELRAAAGPWVRLRSAPGKVGVFVDYEEGLVSFYDVDAAALLHSFTGCWFTERLLPFFDPSLDSAPLIITPVNHTQ